MISNHGGWQDIRSKRYFSTEKNLEYVSDNNLGNRKSLTEKSKEDNREPKCGKGEEMAFDETQSPGNSKRISMGRGSGKGQEERRVRRNGS